jgi:hypothetical protein
MAHRFPPKHSSARTIKRGGVLARNDFLKFRARDEKNSGEVLQILCAALYKTGRRALAWMRGARPVVSVSEIPFALHISI